MLQLTLSPYKFSISADRKYLLLAQNVQKLFRHSYLAQYTIYDITTRYIFYRYIKSMLLSIKQLSLVENIIQRKALLF